MISICLLLGYDLDTVSSSSLSPTRIELGWPPLPYVDDFDIFRGWFLCSSCLLRYFQLLSCYWMRLHTTRTKFSFKNSTRKTVYMLHQINIPCYSLSKWIHLGIMPFLSTVLYITPTNIHFKSTLHQNLHWHRMNAIPSSASQPPNPNESLLPSRWEAIQGGSHLWYWNFIWILR